LKFNNIILAILMMAVSLMPAMAFKNNETYAASTAVPTNNNHTTYNNYVTAYEGGYKFTNNAVSYKAATVNTSLISVYTIYSNQSITLVKGFEKYNEKPVIYTNITNTTSKVFDGNATTYFLQSVASTTQTIISFAYKSSETSTIEFMRLYIVQSPSYNYTNGSYLFNGGTTAQTEIDQPSDDYTYTGDASVPYSMTLLLKGTELEKINKLESGATLNYINQVVVDFYINGRKYTMNTAGKVVDQEIKFTQSGSYIIEIYDKTYNKGEQAAGKRANYKKYTFTIDNGFYMLGINGNVDNDSFLVDGQYTNNPVTLKFLGIKENEHVNIEVRNQTDAKDILYTHKADKTNNSLLINKDGSYSVFNKDTNENLLDFTIISMLKHGKIQIDGTEDDKTITEKESEFVTKTTLSVKVDIPIKGSDSITSITYYTFSYRWTPLSYTSPILGASVASGGRIGGEVFINPVASGNFKLTVNMNGTIHTYDSNSVAIPASFNEIGNYTLTLTDELGNSVNYTFEIFKPMNVASIVLISIGGVALVGLFIVIIKARSNLAVR
ncbi:MAG: hypothetical protein RR334_01405, partial [Clostridia bacterium]